MTRNSNARLIVYLILLFSIILTAFFLSRRNHPKEVRKNTEVRVSENRNYGFDRRTSFIQYTRHARCRMECRNITAREVEEIMQHGSINYRKSDVKGKPCPVYALEGYSAEDEQHLR